MFSIVTHTELKIQSVGKIHKSVATLVVQQPTAKPYRITSEFVIVDGIGSSIFFLACPSSCVYINILDLFITVNTSNNWL
jgi:hypothetical protein